MKRLVSVLIAAFVAIAAIVGFTQDAHAQAAAQPITVSLPFRFFRAATAASGNGLLQQALAAGEADSLSGALPALTGSTTADTTLWLSTADWNWSGADQAPGTASNIVVPALVHFTISSPGACDSVAFALQTSYDGQNAVGGFISTPATFVGATGTSADKYFKWPMLATINSISNNSAYGAPFVRLIVYGDAGGKSGGVAPSITYWRKTSFIPARGQ